MRTVYVMARDDIQWYLVIVSFMNQSDLREHDVSMRQIRNHALCHTLSIIADRARTWYAPREKPDYSVNTDAIES